MTIYQLEYVRHPFDEVNVLPWTQDEANDVEVEAAEPAYALAAYMEVVAYIADKQ